jgi:ATP-dependent DNA helicase RecQ
VLQAVERIIGAQRQELVQFNFRDLSVADEFDQASITYALRELNRLEAFTYVPPFRGRAIRMIHSDLPFEKLEIDFAGLDRRKALELEKLNRVISFALNGTCRQREILRYFGEENAPRCGHCDNCRRQGASAAGKTLAATGAAECAEEDSVAGKTLEAVVMVLSGVARTEARFPCGKTVIAQMLCGSGSVKMSKLRLDKLSTFGLLKHLKQSEVLLMIEALMALRCLEQVEPEPFRPVVQLTDFGREVMKGKASLAGPLPAPLDLLRKLQAGQKGAEERGEAVKGRAEDVERETDDTDHPSHYWTWRLLSAGFTVDECGAIRGLSREIVLEHAERAKHDFEGNGA